MPHHSFPCRASREIVKRTVIPEAWTGAEGSTSDQGLSSAPWRDKVAQNMATFPFFHLPCALTEKAMAPHSSTGAWKIPWAEEPGRLQSLGSLESDTTE